MLHGWIKVVKEQKNEFGYLLKFTYTHKYFCDNKQLFSDDDYSTTLTIINSPNGLCKSCVGE